MAATPSDLLATARELLTRGDAGERHWRAAIHAAYYAAYHAVLPKLPRPPGGAQKHHWIRDQLAALDRSNPDLALRNARYTMRNLMEMRVTADYRLSATITRHDASIAVVRAAQIVEA